MNRELDLAGFELHPQRGAVLAEVHARPFTRLVAPVTVLRFAFLNEGEGAKTIARLDPPGYPGVDRVRVLFRVDARRQLRLSVTDLQSGATLLDDHAVVELR